MCGIINSRGKRDSALNNMLKIDTNLLKSMTEFRNYLCHFEYFIYNNKCIDNNINKKFIIRIRENIRNSDIKELSTENGIVEEVKIIVIKRCIENILFDLGGINYV